MVSAFLYRITQRLRTVRAAIAIRDQRSWHWTAIGTEVVQTAWLASGIV